MLVNRHELSEGTTCFNKIPSTVISISSSANRCANWGQARSIFDGGGVISSGCFSFTINVSPLVIPIAEIGLVGSVRSKGFGGKPPNKFSLLHGIWDNSEIFSVNVLTLSVDDKFFTICWPSLVFNLKVYSDFFVTDYYLNLKLENKKSLSTAVLPTCQLGWQKCWKVNELLTNIWLHSAKLLFSRILHV